MLTQALILETIFRARLHPALGLAVTQEALKPEQLSVSERTLFESCTHPRRKHSWLLGRAVLKTVLAQMGEPMDTGDLVFPNATLSLAHTDDAAIAVTIDPGLVTGIGVDMEPLRLVQQRTERFFLTSDESEVLHSEPADQHGDHRLRLWTVKEALLKANPENGTGKHYHEYVTDDPMSPFGTAYWRQQPEAQYRYGSVAWMGGYVSVAIRE
jgi:4'-phosphopantetheinyl transferase EntD